jgi:hypothetical protein
MDFQPNLAAVPFGRRDSRHMVTQQGDTLWLALAQEGAASLIPTEPRPAGLFEITLLKDGAAKPYTYQTDGFLLALHIEGDNDSPSAAICHDNELNALRIKTQNGVTLRLDGKNPAGVSSLNKPHWGGTEVNIGGGKYFFVAKSGTISFDDTWVVASFGSVTPILDVAPGESGATELIVYELPADTAPPEVTGDWATAAKHNRDDYENFIYTQLRGGLPDKLKYKIWVNSRKLSNGHYAIVGNRLQSSSTNAVEQAIASLAFKDGTAAIDVATSLPQAAPPLLGVAALKLFDQAAPKPDSVYTLIAELEAALKWWNTNRRYPGGYYYAYRHETGLDNPPGFKDNGFAPDETLAKLISAIDIAILTLKQTFGQGAFNEFETINGEKQINSNIKLARHTFAQNDLTQFAKPGSLFAEILSTL